MTRDDLLTLSQRLREYNHNPHHINPVSDAFHKLITESAEALSQFAAIQGGMGEVVEVRGLQWLDTGHYRKKPPQFGYNPHDWNQLMTVAQHERILAAWQRTQAAPNQQAESAPALSYKDDPRTPVELSNAGCRCVRFGEGNPHWPCRIHAGPAQGEREAPVVVATAILGGLFHGGSGPELGEIDIEVCTPALEALQCETVNSSDDVFLPLMTVAQHNRIVAAISAQQSEPERVIVPVEPPRELLMSMALRLDHGLGCPGYYDQPIFGSGVGVTHAQRLESALSDMRKVYEEVTGQGFYSPANAERYSALLASGKDQPK